MDGVNPFSNLGGIQGEGKAGLPGVLPTGESSSGFKPVKLSPEVSQALDYFESALKKICIAWCLM